MQPDWYKGYKRFFLEETLKEVNGMTNFNAEGSFHPIELWEDVAEVRASNTGISIKVIGGVVAGGIGLAIGAEVLGGVVAAWAIKSAFDSVKQMGTRLRLVRDCGCNAFVLNEEEFRTYVSQFGAEEVKKELEFVQSRGIKLTPFASSWLKTSKKALPLPQPQDSAVYAAIESTERTQELRSSCCDITPAPAPAPENPPEIATVPTEVDGTSTKIQENETVTAQSDDTASEIQNREETKKDFSTLPLQERARVLTDQLIADGFKVDEVLDSQVIAISGTQRGGKGTLAGILAILSQALDPSLRVTYFTAGTDVYPFKCELHSSCRYQGMDIEAADHKVSNALLSYLRQIANDPPYSHKNEMLVIDEAMKLFGLMSDEDRQWSLEFLLCRYAKLGATLLIVLHASNLSAVVGSKNTEGLASTFNQSVSFIGCASTSVKGKGLTRLNIASGKYFKADPKNFATPIKEGYLGCIPEWLKTNVSPNNGFPDPVRTLLAFLPELRVDDLREIEKPVNTTPTFLIQDTNSHLEKCFSIAPEGTQEESTITEKEEQAFTDCLVAVLQGASSYPVSFNAIRTSRRWKELIGITTPKREDLRLELEALINDGILHGDEQNGYSFI